ncbi:MAG: DUF1465 family protein [Geminicoccaceae bacterium]
MSVEPLNGHGPSRRRSMLDLLLEESVGLAEDVRDYITSRSPRDSLPGSAVDKLKESAEIGRITSRVTFSVAWLMSRNAVIAGEISHEESLDERHRLGGAGICDIEGDPPSTASTQLLRLSHQSRSLYTRIARLDRDLDPSASHSRH